MPEYNENFPNALYFSRGLRQYIVDTFQEMPPTARELECLVTGYLAGVHIAARNDEETPKFLKNFSVEALAEEFKRYSYGARNSTEFSIYAAVIEWAEKCSIEGRTVISAPKEAANCRIGG